MKEEEQAEIRASQSRVDHLFGVTNYGERGGL